MGSYITSHYGITGRTEDGMIPLSSLLKLEYENEKEDTPLILYGQAFQAKKGEDFTLVKTNCERVLGLRSSTFAVFGVCCFDIA